MTMRKSCGTRMLFAMGILVALVMILTVSVSAGEEITIYFRDDLGWDWDGTICLNGAPMEYKEEVFSSYSNNYAGIFYGIVSSSETSIRFTYEPDLIVNPDPESPEYTEPPMNRTTCFIEEFSNNSGFYCLYENDGSSDYEVGTFTYGKKMVYFYNDLGWDSPKYELFDFDDSMFKYDYLTKSSKGENIYEVDLNEAIHAPNLVNKISFHCPISYDEAYSCTEAIAPIVNAVYRCTDDEPTYESNEGYATHRVYKLEVYEEGDDTLAGYTITLGDNIGVNFYMSLTDTTLRDETAYMQFTLPNGDIEMVYVSEAIQNNGYHIFSCGVAVKEMTADIKAQLITNAGNTDEYVYTVEKYARYIVENITYTEEEIAVAKALLNYGAAAQTMFDYNTDILANRYLEDYDQEIVNVDSSVLHGYIKQIGTAINGVTYAGTSTVWESNTSIRHYFNVEEGANITFKLDGKELTPAVGKYGTYVAIEGIVAKDMAKTYTVTISNGTEEQIIEYSVYSYFYDILKDAKNMYTDAEKNAIMAAYHYSQAAITYLNTKNT